MQTELVERPYRCAGCRQVKLIGEFTFYKKRGKSYRGNCVKCMRLKGKKLKRLRKEEAISAYGGACVCCGETQYEFLTIDHIDNNGASHRKAIFGTSTGGHIYTWLRARGFPKDNYQLLCFNCNAAKGFFGECPHQKLESKRNRA